MKNNEKKLMRRTLIYLHIKFNGKQSLIFDEIVKKRLATSGEVSPEIVNAYFDEHPDDEIAYVTILDKGYSNKLKEEIINPVLVYRKRKYRKRIVN